MEPLGIPELEELLDELVLDELLLDEEELLEEELLLDELLDEELLLDVDELLLEEFPPDEVLPSPPHPTNRTLQASVPPNALSNLLNLYILLFNPGLVIIENPHHPCSLVSPIRTEDCKIPTSTGHHYFI